MLEKIMGFCKRVKEGTSPVSRTEVEQALLAKNKCVKDIDTILETINDMRNRWGKRNAENTEEVKDCIRNHIKFFGDRVECIIKGNIEFYREKRLEK